MENKEDKRQIDQTIKTDGASPTTKQKQTTALKIVFTVLVALALAGAGYLAWQWWNTQKAADEGGMFATLHYFENKEFFDSHQDMYIYTDGHIYTYKVIAAYQYDNRHILNSFNFTDAKVTQQYFDSVLNPNSLVVNVREGAQLAAESDKIVQLSTCTGDANRLVRRYLVTGELVNDQQTY